jgi:hypothetical protein
MDQKLAEALDFSNFMITLNNQKRVLLEKFKTDTIFYQNGATFTVSKELITFLKTLIDTGNTNDVVLVDDNDLPVLIEDLSEFFSNVLNKYFSAANSYYTEYQKLKNKRSTEALIDV